MNYFIIGSLVQDAKNIIKQFFKITVYENLRFVFVDIS